MERITESVGMKLEISRLASLPRIAEIKLWRSANPKHEGRVSLSFVVEEFLCV